MTQDQVSLHSLRLGELFALSLGFVLSTLAVFARVYVRTRLFRPMLKEDHISVLAWLFFLPYTALAVVVGNHDGSPEHIAHLSSIESAIYSPIIIAVKVSILLQYITIFVAHRGTTFHRGVQGLIGANVIQYTIITVLFVTECSPIQKLWKPSMAGHCTSEHTLGIAFAVMAVISDFSILILPFPQLWRLQMPWAKKSRIIAVFAVGSLACIVSVLRLVYRIELAHVPPNTPTYQLDIDRIELWAFAEIAIGIIIGCVPIFPRFFTHIFSHRPLSSSTFSILSSANIPFFRRLFRKSSTSTSNQNPTSSSYPSRVFRPKKTAAPYIETLDLTHNSLHWEEEGGFPKVPPAARMMSSRSRSAGFEGQGYSPISDTENANSPKMGWTRQDIRLNDRAQRGSEI